MKPNENKAKGNFILAFVLFQESIGFNVAENVSSYSRNEEITHGTAMSRPVSVAKDLTEQKGLLLHNSLTS